MFNSFNEMMEEIFKKDKKIADLEAKLAKSKQEANNWKQRFESSEERNKQTIDNGVKALELKNEKIKELKQKLAEKDELLRQKISKMKSTDFIKMCIKSGFMVEAKENDKQTTITELEKLKKEINLRPVVVRNCGYGDFEEILLEDVYDVIDNQIKQLKEMK